MLIGVVRLPGVVDQAAGVDMLAPGADIDIVAHGVNRNNPLRFTIFRTQHHPGLDGLGRFADVDGLAIDIHLTAGDPRPAEKTFHQFAAPGAHQPEQADDFATAHREADRRAHARGFDLLQTQPLFAIGTRFPAVNITQIAPDHRLDQRVVADARHIVKGADVATILKDGDGIAEGKNFFHPV